MNKDSKSILPVNQDSADSPQLEEFLCGGYFIVKKKDNLDQFQIDLMPDSFLTVCRCLTSVLPDTWAIDWVLCDDKERKAQAGKFGLAPYAMIKLIEKNTELFNENKVGWPGVFYSLYDCMSFADRFLTDSHDIEIVGIGLHNSMVSRLLDFERNSGIDTKNGIATILSTETRIDHSGVSLGFEILGYEHGDFHSWICNNLQTDAQTEFGITVNQSGLVDSYKDALKISDYIGQEEVGAEPGLWLPWKIMSY